jgi:hypothetical protein
VVVVASLAWGTKDRRPATGVVVALPCSFFIFMCREYLWVAHGKERPTPSRRGRPSTPLLCRLSHVAHDRDLCRVLPLPTAHGKALCRAKMRRAPFAVRPGRIRANLVVYQSMNSHLRYSAASIVSVNCKKCMCDAYYNFPCHFFAVFERSVC